MANSQLYRKLRFFSLFVPFRLNFIIYLGLMVLIWFLIDQTKVENSSFSILILLMLKIAFFFSIIVVLFSLLTSLFSFLFFQWKKGQDLSMISFELKEQSDIHFLHQVEVNLPEALMPWLGSIQAKLMMHGAHFTQSFLIKDSMKRTWFNWGKGLKSKTSLVLPDIKEYQFSKALIQFQDMLSFFRFSSMVDIHSSLQNLPTAKLVRVESVSPKKTEEEKIRIDQLRKVEGEFLNYKKFENSDDVRRIVWKLYAKHKELVVRIPETMDPFASHVYFYASFYNETNFELYSDFQQEMLNEYKQIVWSFYKSIQSNYQEVVYVSDQAAHSQYSKSEAVQHQITLADWHQELNLQAYFKPKYGSVLCIHSLTSVKELELILSSYDGQTTIVFIPFSTLFRSHFVVNWLLRLFLKPKQDRLTSLKNKWTMHPLKYKVLQQEKEIQGLFSKYDVNVNIVS